MLHSVSLLLMPDNTNRPSLARWVFLFLTITRARAREALRFKAVNHVPMDTLMPSYPSANFSAGSLGGRKTKRPEGRMFID
jgi:hypothetical protein